MRYLVQTEFYIHAENPEEAEATAKMMVNTQKAKLDDQCVVTEIHTQPFGSLIGKQVYP